MQNNDAMIWNSCANATVRRRVVGLTIIEVLVVMAIISIMSGVGMLYINSASFRLQSEARNIRTALFHARQEAIKSNRESTVIVYADRYENSRGESIEFGSENLILTFSNGTALPTGGYTITFSSSGTTPNSNYHLKNDSGDTISIRMNSTGRIWLEKL